MKQQKHHLETKTHTEDTQNTGKKAGLRDKEHTKAAALPLLTAQELSEQPPRMRDPPSRVHAPRTTRKG